MTEIFTNSDTTSATERGLSLVRGQLYPSSTTSVRQMEVVELSNCRIVELWVGERATFQQAERPPKERGRFPQAEVGHEVGGLSFQPLGGLSWKFDKLFLSNWENLS